MKSSTITGVILAIIIIGGAVWLFSGKPAPESTNTDQNTNTSQDANNNSSTNDTTPLPVTVLQAATNTKLGTYLEAPNGMTLYTYTKDTPGVSNCTGTCAVNWPPYTVSSADGIAGAVGVTGLVSTIARADGSMQLTYNNQPLYYYIKDTKVGDVTGQNVGGVWFVIKP